MKKQAHSQTKGEYRDRQVILLLDGSAKPGLTSDYLFLSLIVAGKTYTITFGS